MHRKQDTARPRASRTVLTATAVIACLALTAGCSDGGPKPEDQREEMVAAVTTVIDDVVDRLSMPEPGILDDGTVAIDCPGGTQYRYIAYGSTDYFGAETEVDMRLDEAQRYAWEAVSQVPGGYDYYSNSTYVPEDRNAHGPRQFVLFVEDGTGAGSTLAVDVIPEPDGGVLMRFSGATTCD